MSNRENKSQNKKLFVAFDIENVGDKLDAPINAVGVYVALEDDPKPIIKRRWCMQILDSESEPRCWNEFWMKNIEIWKKLQEEAISKGNDRVLVWKEIANFIDDLYTVYHNKYTIEFLSDNVGFDITRINYFLHVYANHCPIEYTPDNIRPRKVTDVSCEKRYHPNKDAIDKYVKENANHTHYPDDDAYKIYMTKYALCNAKKLGLDT